MLEALILFALSLLSDLMWTVWSRACSHGQSQRAALASAGIYLLAGVTTIAFVSNPWMLIPLGLGAYVGTLIGMKL